MEYDQNSIEELVDRFFTEELDSEEQQKLAELLRSSPVAQNRFRSQMKTEGQLLVIASENQIQSSVAVTPVASVASSESSSMGRHGVLALASLAATLLLAGFLVWVSETPSSAAELFKEIEQVSNQLIDRVYEMERIVREGSDSSTINGTLRCRGTEKFVAELPEVVVGGGANQVWLIYDDGEEFVTSNLGELDDESRVEIGLLRELQEDSDEPVFMGAAKILEVVRLHGYRITRLSKEKQADGQYLIPLVCELENSGKLPGVVRIWADEDSREVFRLELDWGAGKRDGAADLLKYKLISTEPLPDEKFEMKSYQSK